MQLTPTIAIHMSAALSALVLGPIALWARLGSTLHPRVHRASGYAWISMMLASALSAVFIRDYALPNLAGYTPIHLLVSVTLVGLGLAFWAVLKQKYVAHRKAMQSLYWMAFVVPGAFTLMPSRILGKLLWGLS
jgi:uncharacterized membrane protein